MTPEEIAVRWPSTVWGTDEWYAALSADQDLYFRILKGIGHGVKRRANKVLTEREQAYLQDAANGLSQTAIAAKHYVSPNTVHATLKRANTSLGQANLNATIACATGLGLIIAPPYIGPTLR